MSSWGGHNWSSYFGGVQLDIAEAVACGAGDEIYVVGRTYSTGLTSGGWDTSYGTDGDGFVARISKWGRHNWSSYLGGANYDHAHDVGVDSTGSIVVGGETASAGWVSGGPDTTLGGTRDAFVAKFKKWGTHLWSRYAGGGGQDQGFALTVGMDDYIFLAGGSYADSWISGGWDTSYAGDGDAFVYCMSKWGAHKWSTFLGTTGLDRANGIRADASGNIYVTGRTASRTWTSHEWATSPKVAPHGFIVRLRRWGAYRWSAVFGGTGIEEGHGITTDSAGNVYAVGSTSSAGWLSGGWDTTYSGDDIYDGFLIRVNPS